MTPEFESQNNSRQNSLEDSPDSSLVALDTQKRDRFELLSAYLDGEVSAAQRKQVEEWLTTDSQVQCLYKRLLNLRQSFRSAPVPETSQPVEVTVDQVFSRLERRRRHPMLVWGGGAVAAALIAAVSGIFSNPQIAPQLAKAPVTPDSELLMIALSEPVVQIPTVPAAVPAAAPKYQKQPISYPHSIK